MHRLPGSASRFVLRMDSPKVREGQILRSRCLARRQPVAAWLHWRRLHSLLFFLQPVILQWVRIGSFRSSSASVSQVAFAIGFPPRSARPSSRSRVGSSFSSRVSLLRLHFSLGLRVCEPPKTGRRSLREAALPAAEPRHRALRHLSGYSLLSLVFCSGNQVRDASSTSLESCKKYRLVSYVSQHYVVCL